jgi:hypothetical protein
MNCKPGDLAMYVGWMEELRGRIFRVVAPAPAQHWPGIFVWRVDPPATKVWGDLVRDESLKPLRTPGEEETDEMLLIVPSPVWEEAHFGPSTRLDRTGREVA